MRILFKITTALCALSICFNSFAQHSTSSPYSMFGYGEPESRSYGKTSGMGGAETGLFEIGYLNSLNPAGIIMDSLSVAFDVAVAGKISSFEAGSLKENSTNVNLKKISFGFRVYSKVSLNMGLMPFSNVQYKIKTKQNVTGTEEYYDAHFIGSGGLSRIFLGGSYKINKNLSLGTRVSYIFGNINKTETEFNYSSTKTMYANKLNLDFGAMYRKTVSENSEFSAGLTYGYKDKIKFINEREVIIGKITTTTEQTTSSYIPAYLGAGIAFKQAQKHRFYTFALDYRFTNWANVTKPEAPGVYYVDGHKINGGIKYVPNYRTARNYVQRMGFQLGGHYQLTGLKIFGNNVLEYGLTAGAEFPLRNGSTMFLTADLGKRGGKGLIMENYAQLTLGANLSELWFIKWAYD